jgi:uncharacterized membrane protein
MRAACAGKCWYDGKVSSAALLAFVVFLGPTCVRAGLWWLVDWAGSCSAVADVAIVGVARVVYFSILFLLENPMSKKDKWLTWQAPAATSHV